MPFVLDARRLANRLPANDPLRLTLEFLLQNAVGRGNAVPFSQIDRHLQRHGVAMSMQTFQHTVLQATRAGTVFIASFNQGYFLIQNQDDAITMRDWYRNRIRSEARNLRNLRRLARQRPHNWPI